MCSAWATRLAPEHKFSDRVDDALRATRSARQRAGELGCDPPIAVGGVSAGGNLAAVVANRPAVVTCFQLLAHSDRDALELEDDLTGATGLLLAVVLGVGGAALLLATCGRPRTKAAE